MKDDLGQALDQLEIHVNLLKQQPEPFVQTSHLPISDRLASGLPLPDGGSLRADKTPWFGIQVTITRGPFKGFYATVKNVLVNQTTSSGLKVEVRLSHISGSRPFPQELVDYDDIIESK
ncbi:hypothetical protein GALMADRAFT_1134743 [Galerina marginata CBS 339.88]|uniref:KOW domain-containing protein n=1 Tax=Galerina marginata (strain CBS 339.88) TaxID=685588 RepID=A0A067SAA4_GALM3|nr:hypothetical protein GALMADRAFT_1134743 [Galerina marginata CBS 339.88]